MQNEEYIIAIVLFGGMGVVALAGIIFGTIRAVARDRARELSRREIAAYVAEGTMTADEGERLIRAEPSKRGCRDA